MPTVNETVTLESLRIKIDSQIVAEFERQATASGKTLEDLVASRLAYALHLEPNDGSIMISNSQRQRLEVMYKRSFEGGNDLFAYLQQCVSLRIGNATVQLSPELLRRLEARAVRRPLVPFLKEVVVKQLEHFVGLR